MVLMTADDDPLLVKRLSHWHPLGVDRIHRLCDCATIIVATFRKSQFIIMMHGRVTRLMQLSAEMQLPW